MSSTFSALKFELIGTGDQAGSWGNTTNTNIGTAVEEAIVGRATVDFATDADKTITLSNTNATQAARNFVLNVTSTGSLTATRTLFVPAINKPYLIQNNTTGGQSITVSNATGTGVTVPNGKTAFVYNDGTNVVDAITYLYRPTIADAVLSTPTINTPAITGGTVDGAAVTDTSIAPRVTTLSATTSPTVDVDTTDIATMSTTFSSNITLNVSGVAVDGQKFIFRLQTTSVVNFNWGGSFQGSVDLPLPPSSTGSSKYDYLGFIYNGNSSKWQLLAKNFGF